MFGAEASGGVLLRGLAAIALSFTLAACGGTSGTSGGDGGAASDGAGREQEARVEETTADTAGGAADGEASSVETYALPGEQVFPEGVAVDKATGDFFVGSTQDGTIYRGNVDEPGAGARVFLEGGADGREAATGMKVDGRGRLFVAGRRTGRAFVYDAGSGELIRAFETLREGEEGLINDVTFTEDAAYFTDSFRPTLWRVPLRGDEVGEIEPWLNFEDTPLQYEDGFNLNGISVSDDGRYLLAVRYNAGDLWRIDIETREVTQVDLGGDALTNGDGIMLDGRTLYVVRNDPGIVARVEMSEDLLSGEVAGEISDPSFRFPTTIAEYGGRLLVVNSQLNLEPAGSMGTAGAPELPFTVSGVPYPGATRP